MFTYYMRWGLTIHNSKGNPALRGGHVREFTFEVHGYCVFSAFMVLLWLEFCSTTLQVVYK